MATCISGAFVLYNVITGKRSRRRKENRNMAKKRTSKRRARAEPTDVQSSSTAVLDLIDDFDALADRWERETQNMSSLSDIINHTAYRAIIAMGKPAVPKILRRMKTRPAFWFDALRELTSDIEPVDPIRPEMYGNLGKMTNAWLAWGAAHGQIVKSVQI
jgi:hypothetical protein